MTVFSRTLSRSFGHAGQDTFDKEKNGSAATAAKSISPNQLCAAVRDGDEEKVQEFWVEAVAFTQWTTSRSPSRSLTIT